MVKVLPCPRSFQRLDDDMSAFEALVFDLAGAEIAEELIEQKFGDLEGLRIAFAPEGAPQPAVSVVLRQETSFLRGDLAAYQREEAYAIRAGENVLIRYAERRGLLNALSTLKQLLSRRGDAFALPHVRIYDYPNTEVRSVSTTFAWYAGFSRAGFDSQLWDLREWKAFIDTCSDFKVNQVNMCMYGYWPFRFDEFPETTLSNYPMKVWNKENRAWIEIAYSHPNIVADFLPELIRYAHERCIKIFAYVGLNSYNGGYANLHKDRRAVPPSDKYLNDFDSLCLSDPRNIDYLGKAMRRLTMLGVDGIIFEESEENYWFCSCERCTERYRSVASSPADAKHRANRELMNTTLYPAIRAVNPNCEIGIRMLREEPVEKPVAYLEEARDGLPPDIYLYWAPGPYCPESEFEKWVRVFGPDRICARDQEGSGFSASMGRLFYMFPSNVLRPDVEHLHWSIEADIDQYVGAARHRCRGINGYLFEYTGFFLYLFSAAQYGWNASLPPAEFPSYALSAVFGEELASAILDVVRNTKIVHESQLPICELFFPFLRHKVGSEDVPLLEAARGENGRLVRLLGSVLTLVEADRDLRRWALHFEKLRHMLMRQGVIYDLCLAAIRYVEAVDPVERSRLLLEVGELNERDFAMVRDFFFDVNPHSQTGIKVCGLPYHEIKRTINNLLDPEHPDEMMIYLGTETLGFLWI
jgi:Glycosyl hydrolase family 20, domain 2